MVIGGDRHDASICVTRLRTFAAAFLKELSASTSRENAHWIDEWIAVGDRHRASAELAVENNMPDAAGEFWLCALIAYEVARQLGCSENLSSVVLENRIDGSLSGFRRAAPDRVVPVELECFEGMPLAGYLLPAARSGQPAPVVIFVSDEQSSAKSIVSRVLPAVNNRNLSVLAVSGNDASKYGLTRPEAFLACWLNYLECRADVDADRMAVWGERMAASYASRIAASDHRIMAAVCDGGLWASLRHRAHVGWMTGVWDPAFDRARTSCLQLVRRMQCPVLIMAGGGTLLDPQCAVELQSDCRFAGLDCSIGLSQAEGGIENFIAKDDFVLDWLENKLRSDEHFAPGNDA